MGFQPRENHHGWNGGQYLKEGYRYLLSPNHHFVNNKGYVAEHRLVWERNNDAILMPWADVHHLNGIKLDNRPENLQAVTHSFHLRLRRKKQFDRLCHLCKATTTSISRGYYNWYRDGRFWICRKCYLSRWAMATRRLKK